MPRYELPPDLTSEEERAVLAALEEALRSGRPRPSRWLLAGRAENLGLGALQVRREADREWTLWGQVPFARRGVPTFQGRSDAR